MLAWTFTVLLYTTKIVMGSFMCFPKTLFPWTIPPCLDQTIFLLYPFSSYINIPLGEKTVIGTPRLRLSILNSLILYFWSVSLLWWGLRDAMIYKFNNKSLGVILKLCLVSRIILIGSPLWPVLIYPWFIDSAMYRSISWKGS